MGNTHDSFQLKSLFTSLSMLGICCLSCTESELFFEYRNALGCLRTVKVDFLRNLENRLYEQRTVPILLGKLFLLPICYVSEALRMRKRKVKVKGVLHEKLLIFFFLSIFVFKLQFVQHFVFIS